ncbi:hypothetical protein IJX73_03515 [bacterium]|nr:hypothetical protein [bacterium]
MKKLALILIAINLFLAPSYSFEFFKKSRESEVRSVLNKHIKAMESHDIEAIKSFYDKNYRSTDGFNLAELEEMLIKTYETYGNIKYKVKINSIVADSECATVQISDSSSAVIYPSEGSKKIKRQKSGKLYGKSVYNMYLKKINNEWKIVKDDILMEETSLKFGVAKNIDMNIIAPEKLQNGQEYDLSIKINKPKDIMALGSISREEIVYPPSDYQEKFRRISDEGELERIVRANDKNLDEYAVASIGFTKISLNEEQTKAKIEVLGMAYLMKRINMNQYDEDKKTVENN